MTLYNPKEKEDEKNEIEKRITDNKKQLTNKQNQKIEKIFKLNQLKDLTKLILEDEYIKAETVFNELKSGTSLYREKSVWNLALIKLKHKDYKGCKQILQTISQDFEYYDEVQELLRALE